MQEEIILRQAVPADLPTLLTFEQNIIAAERPFDTTLQEGYISYYDLEKMLHADDAFIVVAVFNNTLIASGYAQIKNSDVFLKHKRHAYLGFMYVVPEQRGKGVSKKIIELLIAWCRQHDITELRLDVYDKNITAMKAYEKAGFTKHLVEMRMGI